MIFRYVIWAQCQNKYITEEGEYIEFVCSADLRVSKKIPNLIFAQITMLATMISVILSLHSTGPCVISKF